MGRVRVCMLCVCVREYHRDDGEGEDLEEIPRLSYTRRYISLVVDSGIQSETGGCCDNQWTCVHVRVSTIGTTGRVWTWKR